MSSDPKKSLEDIFKPFRDFARGLQTVVQAVQPILKVYGPEIKKVLEGLSYWHEKSLELADELKKEDVFLIPYFSDVANIPKLVDRIKNEHKSMLEIYDDAFCQKEEVKKLLESWMDNPFFQGRKEILERCLAAHTEKDYIFTIPIFYIHIERYCKHLLGVDGTNPHIPWKKMLRDAYHSEKEQEGISKYLSESYAVEILTQQIFEKYPEYQKLVDPLYPNRHDVLHGSNLDYFKKEYTSLRCILLLDVLSDIEPKSFEAKT